MAVTKMLLVNVTGKMNKLDTVLDACCRSDDFHLEQATSFFRNNSDFVSLNEENPYSQYYAKLQDAVTTARLKPMDTEADDSLMTWEEMTAFVDEFSERIKQLADKREDISRELEETDRSMAQFEHFKGLDLKLNEIFACEYIKVRFGRMPKDSYQRLSYYGDNPFVTMFPCTSDKQYVWGVYFTPIESAAEVDRIFQSLFWERLRIPAAVGTPEEACDALELRRGELAAQKEKTVAELDAYWEQKKLICSKLLLLLERRKSNFYLRRNVARYHDSDTFFLAGWVPGRNAKEFSKRLDDIDGIEYELTKPEPDSGQSPPVKLHNRAPFRPFEFFVNMYGLPTYRELDPTPFVAITYFLLFGMMFADLGQGIILTIAGLVLWRKTHSDLWRSISICGISSSFFGVLLGSVFGFETWLNPFWQWVHDKTGVPLTDGKLINVDHSETITTLIYATIGIGAVLLMCAIMLNIYTKLRQRMFGEALFGQNGVAGLMFYGGLVIGLVSDMVLGVHLMNTAYIVCLIVIPLVLIFLREPLGDLIEGKEDWLPESIGGFIMQNFFELFEVLLSYVSNTVSFLRVGAFILVHYGMMTVVFTLAELSPEGSAGYIIVVIIGNGIIIALEGLLVGIQSLRLEFYEMFSRFFSGSGRPFVPSCTGAAQDNH